MKKLIISTLSILTVLSIILFTLNLSQPKAAETITESFLITSIDQDGYVRGELTKSTGEGIYYHINELTAFNVEINVGDTIIITWAKDNYNNAEWDVIESVTVR